MSDPNDLLLLAIIQVADELPSKRLKSEDWAMRCIPQESQRAAKQCVSWSSAFQTPHRLWGWDLHPRCWPAQVCQENDYRPWHCRPLWRAQEGPENKDGLHHWPDKLFKGKPFQASRCGKGNWPFCIACPTERMILHGASLTHKSDLYSGITFESPKIYCGGQNPLSDQLSVQCFHTQT